MDDVIKQLLQARCYGNDFESQGTDNTVRHVSLLLLRRRFYRPVCDVVFTKLGEQVWRIHVVFSSFHVGGASCVCVCYPGVAKA